MIRDRQSTAYGTAYQNAFLRRGSPPGSPSPKPCCYEHPRAQPPSFFCCCYSCSGGADRNASLLAAVGVCLLVLAYTVLGAFLFMSLEGGLYDDAAAAAAAQRASARPAGTVDELRAETVDRLWSITENLNILYRENWTRLAAEEVLVFQEALFKARGSGVGTATYYRNYHKWSFSSSFLYSLTLITTIGYGSVSPHTAWGKLVTILYALVGIPLMLMYLSATGDVLARCFRKLYGKMCGVSPKTFQCPCTNKVRVPVTLCLVIVLAYICSGAVLFHRLENWSLLEGSYFCFTSLGTIGFGNLVPGQRTEEISLCACSAYILTGMALVAMCFSLVQDEVLSLFRYLGTTCSKSDAKLKDEEGS
ncbi:unnamed protein product [Phyllotreta striolata]|uniref:Potassium channel domain-containing protein n=1 Tax=Phyllotreta striolata TaxID=444603 RepID=A0A9N9TSJ9_PHYSR|nr:unnamed protein product [Phyllotreta striolata]